MKKYKFSDETGAALIVALGAFVVISILGVAAITVASNSVSQTVWDRSSNQAFALAEGGFNQAVFRARQGTLTGGGWTSKMPNGEISVTVTQTTGISYMYEVKAVGAQPSFANPRARRAVAGKVTALNPYSVLLASGAAGKIIGSCSVDGPFYIRDVLQLQGTAAFTGGPLYIKDVAGTSDYNGDLIFDSGSSSVGTAANPVYAFIDGTVGPPDRVNQLKAKAIYGDVPELETPIITSDDMPAQRASADVVVDNPGDTATNGNYNTPQGLNFDRNKATTTFGSYPGGYYLRWENPGLSGSRSRVLRINGAVFVDGQVSFGGSQVDDIVFIGKGTIISNGKITINSPLRPSADADFPDIHAVGFITPYDMEINASTGDKIYAIAYAKSGLTMTKQINFYGSAMTDLLTVSNNPHLFIRSTINPANVPRGMPKVKVSTTITDWGEVQP